MMNLNTNYLLCEKLLRVVDDLEAIAFFKGQVIWRSGFVVVQGHEERDSTWEHKNIRPSSPHSVLSWGTDQCF